MTLARITILPKPQLQREKTSSRSERDAQEPLEVFQARVAKLCDAEFDSVRVEIEYMKGGSFNRLAALRIYTDPKEPLEYVLRMPRVERSPQDWGLEYDVRVQKYARQHLGSIVPKIVQFRKNQDNVLSLPYTIQERLPGSNLDSLWRSLSTAQKESALRIVVDLTRRLQAIMSCAAGVIAPADASGTREAQLHTFLVGHCLVGAWQKPWKTDAVPQTTREFLCNQAARWKDFGQYSNELGPEWDEFQKIARALYDQGLIPDTDRFHLCHLDLYPRNLLVEVIDDSTLSLTGLVDWDAAYAHFCPKFVAYRAPFWLWLEEGMDESDEMLAATDPAAPELARLKALFEEMAGEEWKRYAFAPEYMYARRMFKRLRDGNSSHQDDMEAADIIKGWHELEAACQ